MEKTIIFQMGSHSSMLIKSPTSSEWQSGTRKKRGIGSLQIKGSRFVSFKGARSTQETQTQLP